MIMNEGEFLIRAGLPGKTLEFWLQQQWIIPEKTTDGVAFSDRDVARARLIQELKGDFGVNDEGVDLILHLMDQLHGLRQVLAVLRPEMRKTSE